MLQQHVVYQLIHFNTSIWFVKCDEFHRFVHNFRFLNLSVWRFYWRRDSSFAWLFRWFLNVVDLLRNKILHTLHTQILKMKGNISLIENHSFVLCLSIISLLFFLGSKFGSNCLLNVYLKFTISHLKPKCRMSTTEYSGVRALGIRHTWNTLQWIWAFWKWTLFSTFNFKLWSLSHIQIKM